MPTAGSKSQPMMPLANTSQSLTTASTLPPTHPRRSQSQSNRGCRRTTLLKTTSQILPQDQERNATRVGLARADSAPAVRVNSSRKRAQSLASTRGRSQVPRASEVHHAEVATRRVFPELETAIGSGDFSPLALAITPNTTRQRSSQPSQPASSPIRPEIQRGRTQRRATPLPQPTQIPETPPSRRPASSSRGRPITPRSPSKARSRSRRTILGELPITQTANKSVRRDESVRVLKGGFVIKTPLAEQYKFPKSSSQPGPVWRSGDGFSEDEADTDFLFYATGTRKRRRSRTLSRMGKLAIGAEETESPSIRPSNKRSRGIGIYENIELLRGDQKEPWPNKTDFEDCILSTRPKKAPQQDHDDIIIPATFRSQRGQSEVSGSTIKYIPGHKKGLLDFANFRKSEVVKSTFPQDNLLSQIRIGRDESDSGDGDDAEEMPDEDDCEPSVDEDSQVDSDCKGGAAPYCSTGASTPSGAYWDADGNHVFPGDESYEEEEMDKMDEEYNA
ncbi:hypothetical protein PG999_009089 [Apiospora kogelbergensis]|uniref:Transcription factor Iwr1 domain-containing protein n=1 Tax=Apiospora kogelbergensis TaxID=1337665 RepID=A0AAW0QNI8_9PEZI